MARAKNGKRITLLITAMAILSLIVLGPLKNSTTDMSSASRAGMCVPSNPDITSDMISHKVNPHHNFTKGPAPMGIADYGINPSTNESYSYNTSSFLGSATIRSFTVNGGVTGQLSSAQYSAGIQLNVVMKFAVLSNIYAYWLQDVVEIDTSQNYVTFLDNIWNFSSAPHYASTISRAGIVGSGSVGSYGNGSFYGVVAGSGLPGNGISLTYPCTIFLEINSTIDPWGLPVATFSYNDGFSWVTYDTVTFLLPPGPLVDSQIVVNGSEYAPIGLFYDAELVFGGSGGGLSTAAVSSDADLTLSYSHGTAMQEIPFAYNFGSDTAETISNVQCQTYTSGGVMFMKMTQQTGILFFFVGVALICLCIVPLIFRPGGNKSRGKAMS
ncbi:MAG TPA: thermopsin [Candidatus Lokiarchaeia archaeon]|nr:thermopsin [Candidatus Lokiarchaeia archaeon]